MIRVMHSFQCKIPGGHETKMGKLRGVQGAALSRVMGKENPRATLQRLRAGTAAQVFSRGCVMELSLYWQAATLLRIQTHSSIIPGLCTRDECRFLNIFSEATNTMNRILHNWGHQIFP